MIQRKLRQSLMAKSKFVKIDRNADNLQFIYFKSTAAWNTMELRTINTPNRWRRHSRRRMYHNDRQTPPIIKRTMGHKWDAQVVHKRRWRSRRMPWHLTQVMLNNRPTHSITSRTKRYSRRSIDTKYVFRRKSPVLLTIWFEFRIAGAWGENHPQSFTIEFIVFVELFE